MTKSEALAKSHKIYQQHSKGLITWVERDAELTLLWAEIFAELNK